LSARCLFAETTLALPAWPHSPTLVLHCSHTVVTLLLHCCDRAQRKASRPSVGTCATVCSPHRLRPTKSRSGSGFGLQARCGRRLAWRGPS
jgi:hypothetical protein